MGSTNNVSIICPTEVNRLLNFQNYMQETGKYAPVNAALQMTVSASGKLVQPIVKELKYIYFNKLRILKFHLKFSETCN
jgi:hypothetical protein